MDVRERLLAALYWNEPDRIPVTIYSGLLPRGFAARKLRESGLGLILRPPVHRAEWRRVDVASKEYWEQGQRLIRQTIRTPVGEIYQIAKPDAAGYENNTWVSEHFIKRPEDYAVMEYFIKDAIYHDNYASINEAKRRIGRDGLVYARIAKSPIQEILYRMMGIERFSMHLYDYPDLIDSLHEVMAQRYEELFELAAGAPVEILLLSDNLTADVIGVDRYETYLAPTYRSLKKWLVGTDKKVAVHMDGRLAALKNVVAAAEFDIVEAFTPPPVGDFSIADARQAWPDKALWLNFTSCMHIETPDVIAAHTRELIEQAGSKRGFAIGVTENAPVEALEASLATITNVINEYVR